MNITAILIAAAVIAVAGIIVGIGLGLFGEKFKVEVDEKEVAIREELPGNNCGRNTPNALYRETIHFFKNISTICTRAAITRIKTMVFR